MDLPDRTRVVRRVPVIALTRPDLRSYWQMTMFAKLLLLLLSSSFFLLRYSVALNVNGKCIHDGTNITRPVSSISSSETKWAIAALVENYHDGNTFKRNEFLAKYLGKFNSTLTLNRSIDIIFFSEKIFKSHEIELCNREFQNLSVTVRHINTKKHELPANMLHRGEYSFGYKAMCKFFSKYIYEELLNYDYFIRLDTDCYITELDYNIFEWAENENITYAYLSHGIESHQDTISTMPQYVLNYSRECNLVFNRENYYNYGYTIDVVLHYYNNFHIGKTSFFLRRDVYHFLDSITENKMFFNHRWGDACSQAYAVRFFSQDSDVVKEIKNMTYVHGSHRMKICNKNNVTHVEAVRGIKSHILSGNYDWWKKGNDASRDSNPKAH